MTNLNQLFNQAWLQIGLNQRDQLIHISESVRGKKCGLVCPYCRGSLIAKKGPVTIHHYAHVKDSCRPDVHRFDFWGDTFEDVARPLDEFAYLYRAKLQAERIRLTQDLASAKTDSQHSEALVAELVELLISISKPFKNGDRPANRQANFEVLQEVQEYIESSTHDRGAMPELYRIRHSRFDLYWYPWVDYWGAYSDNGRTIFPSKLWEEELDPQATIIPKVIMHHYNGLAMYHQYRNTVSELTVEQEAFERTLIRFNTFRFYFLRVTLSDRILYKPGITSRPLPERLAEIKHDLKAYGVIALEPLAVVKQAGFLEAYFKRKYVASQAGLTTTRGPLTEYFDLPDDEVVVVVASLNALVSKEGNQQHAGRANRIRAGMRLAQETGKPIGRPKVAELTDTFLQKPKSQLTMQLLQDGLSLREVERRTGFSINTVRKVFQLIK